MDDHLRAGIAVYNAGGYHAAHDAWEDHWLDLESGTDDERFLHGLIQFTAAVFHARNRNWSGATGLAESGQTYLANLPEKYRGVNVGSVRAYLDSLGSDPEHIERQRPLQLTYEGTRLGPDDLKFQATCIAAEVLAEEFGDEDLIEPAIEFASQDVTDGSSTPFVALVFDYVREPDDRGIIRQRLGEHVDKRAAREADVAGLFDERE